MCPHCKRDDCRLEVVLDDGFRTCALVVVRAWGPMELKTLAKIMGQRTPQAMDSEINRALARFCQRARDLGVGNLVDPSVFPLRRTLAAA